ncbi:YbaK/EbsC family protein [Curtobacterium pusillum]|uniref:YbaK/EbsC family protein n=1 Tax=Curtobacterium pusillum TaxID=69373 RepID=UPI0011AA64E1|nr:YbaK/EbsC family protein [Curtobacterium pusillum]
MNDRLATVQRIVAEAGIDSTARELPASTHTAADAAAALGTEPGAIASSLLFLADGESLLAMTSGRHRVDTDLLAAQLGVEVLAMATAKQVREVTGQPIGGVSPVGHPAPIRTVVDEALREYDVVWSAAGTANSVLPLTFDQLLTLTGGTVVRVNEH